jgi:hypothetical protein
MDTDIDKDVGPESPAHTPSSPATSARALAPRADGRQQTARRPTNDPATARYLAPAGTGAPRRRGQAPAPTEAQPPPHRTWERPARHRAHPGRRCTTGKTTSRRQQAALTTKSIEQFLQPMPNLHRTPREEAGHQTTNGDAALPPPPPGTLDGGPQAGAAATDSTRGAAPPGPPPGGPGQTPEEEPIQGAAPPAAQARTPVSTGSGTVQPTPPQGPILTVATLNVRGMKLTGSCVTDLIVRHQPDAVILTELQHKGARVAHAAPRRAQGP